MKSATGIIQFVYAFSAPLAAQEYTRIRFETKKIGEENYASPDKKLTKQLRKQLKTKVKDFHKLVVLNGDLAGSQCMTVFVAVRCVSTKVFISCIGRSVDAALHLAYRALLHLDNQLDEGLTKDKGSMAEVPYNRPDLTCCGFCGKSGKLKTCTRCSQTKYCGVECQRNHHEMAAPFGHKPFCKSVVRATRHGRESERTAVRMLNMIDISR